MDWKNQLTKTPYLVLFVVLATVGISTAYALVTITLAGDVIIEGDTEIEGNLKLDGGHSGILWNSKVPVENIITIADSSQIVGLYTSLTIGVDGLPVISYYDSSNGELKVAKCKNPACTSPTKTTVDNSTPDVGQYSSITIGLDGFPVISYYDRGNGSLKLAKCNNHSCTLSSTTTVDNTATNVGLYTSITTWEDGFPVISYYDSTNGALKVAKCNNSACTSPSTFTVDNTATSVGLYSSIAFGLSNSRPVISYYDQTNGNLKYAKCNNPGCTTSSIITIDSDIDVGSYSSITIGLDGQPIISYRDEFNDDLKVAHCSSSTCIGKTITPVDIVADRGQHTSITIGADGFPLISYYAVGAGHLLVAHCSNTTCSSADTNFVIDGKALDVGTYNSVAIGTDGLPVISYYDESLDDLKIVKCANIYCKDKWIRR